MTDKSKEAYKKLLSELMEIDFKEHTKKFPAICSIRSSKGLFNSGWVTGYKQRQQLEKVVRA